MAVFVLTFWTSFMKLDDGVLNKVLYTFKSRK